MRKLFFIFLFLSVANLVTKSDCTTGGGCLAEGEHCGNIGQYDCCGSMHCHDGICW